MGPGPRTNGRYRARLAQALLGEQVAAGAYLALAARTRDEPARSIYRAIAAVERCTAGVLQPAVVRHGIGTRRGSLELERRRHLARLRSLDWVRFLDRASAEWPAYVTAYRALLRIAPPRDRAALRLLVAHEEALVECIALERAGRHAAALRRLEGYLALARAFATPAARGASAGALR